MIIPLTGIRTCVEYGVELVDGSLLKADQADRVDGGWPALYRSKKVALAVIKGMGLTDAKPRRLKIQIGWAP